MPGTSFNFRHSIAENHIHSRNLWIADLEWLNVWGLYVKIKAFIMGMWGIKLEWENVDDSESPNPLGLPISQGSLTSSNPCEFQIPQTFSEAIILQGKVNLHTLYFFLVLIPFKSLGPITLWNSEQDLYGKQNYKHCLIYICLALGNMHKSKHTECRTRERKTQMLIGLSFSLCVHLSESLDLWMILSS